MLAPGAQAHVTVKLRPPYSEWNVEAQARASGLRLPPLPPVLTGRVSSLPPVLIGRVSQARAAGFRLARVTHFDQSRFPGYRHQTTKARSRPPPLPTVDPTLVPTVHSLGAIPPPPPPPLPTVGPTLVPTVHSLPRRDPARRRRPDCAGAGALATACARVPPVQ